MNILMIGCGYVGLPLARVLAAAGHLTVGITASKDSAHHLRAEPFSVLAADISLPGSLQAIATQSFDVVVHAASSGRRGSEGYRAVFLEGVQHVLESLRVDHLLLTSSTSVYGQTDGNWVDESSAAEPSTETGRILRQAEDVILKHGGTVARLAGIYGPGRCVPLRKFLDATAVLEGAGERMMNQIHQQDAVSALCLLAERRPGGIFNVADNEPVSQREWFEWLGRRLGRPLPPFGERDLKRKRGWTSKKVSNQKLSALGWKPSYPSFRDGLEELLSRGA